MANSFVQVPADSVGKKVDAASLDVGVDSVQRQRIILADNTGTSTYATILSSGPAGTEGGLVVRNIPSGTQTIAGTIDAISTTVQVAIATPFTINNISATVNVAGTFTISTIDSISATVNTVVTGFRDGSGTAINPIDSANTAIRVNVVAGSGGGPTHVSLDAGTANIGFINHISATTIVAGVISLGAGANNIGFINNISATVVVAGTVSLAAGTANIGFINNISATVAAVLAAGTANIGFINNISATVNVAFAGGVSLAAGTANIGFKNNIGATVATVVVGYTPAIMSASHGPKRVTASTSANVTLIASPGAGANIFVTQIMCGNMSATLTRARIGTSASIATVVQPMAASGGGLVLHFDPPWMLSASEACLCSVKPNVADGFFTVNFFVK